MIRTPRPRVLGGLALAAAPVVYVVTEAVAAAAWTNPPYSYAENYVSDLGVTGPREIFLGHDIYSPLAPVMNAGFIADGFLALLATILIVRFQAGRRAKAIWTLSALFAAGITLVGVFHGSRLSQQAGTLVFHFLGAPVAIIAGNLITILAGTGAAALGLSPRLRRPLIILGITGVTALAAEIVIIGGIPSFPAGIFERLAVYAVLASQLTLGLAATGVRRLAATTPNKVAEQEPGIECVLRDVGECRADAEAELGAARTGPECAHLPEGRLRAGQPRSMQSLQQEPAQAGRRRLRTPSCRHSNYPASFDCVQPQPDR